MARVHIVLFAGVIAVSFAAIFIRLADAPVLVIAAYRMCLASIVAVPAALLRSGGKMQVSNRRELLLALLSGAFLALHFVLWIASLSYTSVATSVVLVTANPLFVAVLSYIFFHERLGRRTALGIFISITGSVIIGYGNWRLGASSLYGSILALSAALAMAGYLLVGRRLRRNMDLTSSIALVYSSAALVLLAVTLISGQELTGYSPSTYLMLVLLALVPQLIGHVSFNWALRLVPATLVTIAILGEPVGATILAHLILGETPTLNELGGSVLLLAGIFTAFYRREHG